jgi:hypothetical protein
MSAALPPNLPPDVTKHALDFQSRLNQQNLFHGALGPSLGTGSQIPFQPAKRGGRVVLIISLILFGGFFLFFKVVLPLISLSIIFNLLSR